jgi:ribosome maturation factor RimP
LIIQEKLPPELHKLIPQSPFAERIEGIIAESLLAMGYVIVQIRQMGGDNRKILQIMLDKVDGTEITLDDCSKASNLCSLLFDVDEPFSGAYDLEMSSAGMDRVLVCKRDFEKYLGFEVKAETLPQAESRRRFRGKLSSFDERIFQITGEAGNKFDIEFNQTIFVRLVVTDELIKLYSNKK